MSSSEGGGNPSCRFTMRSRGEAILVFRIGAPAHLSPVAVASVRLNADFSRHHHP